MRSEGKTDNYKSFHYLENGEIGFSVYDTITTKKTLDPDVYEVTYLEHPYNRIKLVRVETREIRPCHEFEDRKKIDDLLTSFFNPELIEHMAKIDMVHKMGVLLHGKEGTGKTSIAKYYFLRAVKEQQAVVFYINNWSIEKCWEFVQSIRKIQDNPIVIFFDEVDRYMRDYEPTLKAMLDGLSSVDNSIVFAATNYLERIPEALRRPSRFKYIIDVQPMAKFEDIVPIVRGILSGKFSEQEIEELSRTVVGKTIDDIKHACLDRLMKLTSTQSNNRSIGFKMVVSQ